MTITQDPIGFAKDAKRDAEAARKSGEYERAAKLVSNAIKVLKDSIDALPSDARTGARGRDLAKALSDIYGKLGGIRRTEGEYVLSAQAYDDGAKIERDPSYGVVDSYNTTQRLIARVMIDPACLEMDKRTVKDEVFPDVLLDGEKIVADQIAGSRQQDPWAHADRAVLLLLLGESDKESAAWERMNRLNPPVFVFSSTQAMLNDLRTRLENFHGENAESAPSASLLSRLNRTVGWLDRRASAVSASPG